MNPVSDVTDESKAGGIHKKTPTISSESQPWNSKCIRRYLPNIWPSLFKKLVVGDSNNRRILMANALLLWLDGGYALHTHKHISEWADQHYTIHLQIHAHPDSQPTTDLSGQMSMTLVGACAVGHFRHEGKQSTASSDIQHVQRASQTLGDDKSILPIDGGETDATRLKGVNTVSPVLSVGFGFSPAKKQHVILTIVGNMAKRRPFLLASKASGRSRLVATLIFVPNASLSGPLSHQQLQLREFFFPQMKVCWLYKIFIK